MRRKYLIGSVSLVMILVLFLFFFQNIVSSDKIGPQNWKVLKIGMSQMEVEAIIGLPIDSPRVGKEFARVLTKQSGISLDRIQIGNQAKSDFQTMKWIGNDYAIWVAFSEERKVVGTFLWKTIHLKQQGILVKFLEFLETTR
jgi:hypothetical protein